MQKEKLIESKTALQNRQPLMKICDGFVGVQNKEPKKYKA